MKRILTFMMIALLLFGGVLLAAGSTASLVFTTSVGENTSNSGVRLIKNVSSSDTLLATTGSGPTNEFDTKFLASASTLTLANELRDNSLENVEAFFSVLVRRAKSTTMVVTISPLPLSNGNYDLAYSVSSVQQTYASGATAGFSFTSAETTPSETTLSETSVLTYSVSPTGTPDIVRHQNMFKISVPKDISAPLGLYSTTMTFTFTIT